MNRRNAWALVLPIISAFTHTGWAQPRSKKPARETPAKAAADKPAKETPAKSVADKADKAVADKPERADKAATDRADKPAKDAPAKATAGSAEAADEQTASDAGDGLPPGDDLGPPPKGARQSGTRSSSPLNPLANEFPASGVALPPRAYDDLLAEIATLRGRVAALTTTLFASKLRITVEADGENARIARLLVTVDEGVVYSAPARFTADEPRIVYEHAVAPGYHVVAVDVERYDARNPQYRSWQTSKFSVVVPESKRLDAAVSIEDESGMAEDFPDDRDGEYELQVRLRASVEE